MPLILESRRIKIMPKGDKFTVKQQRFINFYDGNATDAARKAGYIGNENTINQTAIQLLRNAKIAKAIQSREKKNQVQKSSIVNSVKSFGRKLLITNRPKCPIGLWLLSCLVCLMLISPKSVLSTILSPLESFGKTETNPMPDNEYQDVIIKYRPHPGQQLFHDSQARFRVLACGARWGKERCCVPEMINAIARQANEPDRLSRNLVPNIHWWAVGPTYALTKQLWMELKFFTPSKLIETINESDKYIRWKKCYGGALIEMKSARKPEELVSVGLDGVLITECGLLTQKVWRDSIRPRLSSRLGQGIFNGTPRGKRESRDTKKMLYEAYLKGQDPDNKEWWSINQPTSGNPYIPASEIASMKIDINDEKLFNQNILAMFLEFEAGKAVYGIWKQSQIIECNKVWNKRNTVIRGWDRGFHFPACVWSYVNGEDQLCLAREVMGEDITRDDFIKYVVEKSGIWFPDADFVDYTPADLGQKESDGKSWRQVMKANGISPKEGKAGRDEVVRRTDAVRKKMKLRQDNKFGMIVDSRCEILIEGFEGGYHYPEVVDKPEDEKPEKDGYYDHLQDALAVICDNHFTVLGEGKQRMRHRSEKKIYDPVTGRPLN